MKNKLDKIIEQIYNNSITQVDLSRDKIGDEGAKALWMALEKNTSITQVNLSSNEIGDEGAKALGMALEKNTSITQVDLRDNQIGDEGAKALGMALEKNTSITQVDLRDNQIGDEGAKALGMALEKNTSITQVNLSINQIGDEGAKALGMALEKNTSITQVDLSSNQIGDEGAKALWMALEKNTSITKVDLSSNQIGDEGAKALGMALEKNTSITQVDLRDNQIGDEGAKALRMALERNTSITQVNLFWNQIEAEGGKAIEKIVVRNVNITKLNKDIAKLNKDTFTLSNIKNLLNEAQIYSKITEVTEELEYRLLKLQYIHQNEGLLKYYHGFTNAAAEAYNFATDIIANDGRSLQNGKITNKEVRKLIILYGCQTDTVVPWWRPAEIHNVIKKSKALLEFTAKNEVKFQTLIQQIVIDIITYKGESILLHSEKNEITKGDRPSHKWFKPGYRDYIKEVYETELAQLGYKDATKLISHDIICKRIYKGKLQPMADEKKREKLLEAILARYPKENLSKPIDKLFKILETQKEELLTNELIKSIKVQDWKGNKETIGIKKLISDFCLRPKLLKLKEIEEDKPEIIVTAKIILLREIYMNDDKDRALTIKVADKLLAECAKHFANPEILRDYAYATNESLPALVSSRIVSIELPKLPVVGDVTDQPDYS